MKPKCTRDMTDSELQSFIMNILSTQQILDSCFEYFRGRDVEHCSRCRKIDANNAARQRRYKQRKSQSYSDVINSHFDIGDNNA
jgi:hypothetical protein